VPLHIIESLNMLSEAAAVCRFAVLMRIMLATLLRLRARRKIPQCMAARMWEAGPSMNAASV
jgi:hypothetical protein